MKKLSILIALMLCITIGGVYATWSYAGTNDIADQLVETKVTIANIEYKEANGTYTIESNLVLTVDQANQQHEAKLVYGSNNSDDPYIKVTFTAADYASPEIKENAVLSELYFSTTTTMQYENKDGQLVDIFWLSNTGNSQLDNTFTWTPEGNGKFSYTLDKAAIETCIKLNGTFVLGTKSEHDAFREALNGNIVARVTDGTVN